MLPHRLYNKIAWLAVLLALIVIVFGAFVRLSNAGLSCPDWPTCYGRAAWPVHEVDVAHANANYERPVETHKAWREQVHRHLAATLGLMVLALAVLAARRVRGGLAITIGASVLVAAAIPIYMSGQHVWASVLAAIGEIMLLAYALRPPSPASPRGDFTRLSALLLAVIIFQALLGMWTVTWLLKPIVVMAHLMGGMTTFCLLVFLACRASPNARIDVPADVRIKPMLIVGLVLVSIQIALGGWVSANYAALACGTNFPHCLGSWTPPTDFGEGFVLWRGIGVDYEGGVLDAPARIAIHLTHRIFALVVAGHLIALGFKLRKIPQLHGWGMAIWVMLGAQVLLGILNVIQGLPLKTAVMHNAGAAILLFALVSLLARVRARS